MKTTDAESDSNVAACRSDQQDTGTDVLKMQDKTPSDKVNTGKDTKNTSVSCKEKERAMKDRAEKDSKGEQTSKTKLFSKVKDLETVASNTKQDNREGQVEEDERCEHGGTNNGSMEDGEEEDGTETPSKKKDKAVQERGKHKDERKVKKAVESETENVREDVTDTKNTDEKTSVENVRDSDSDDEKGTEKGSSGFINGKDSFDYVVDTKTVENTVKQSVGMTCKSNPVHDNAQNTHKNSDNGGKSSQEKDNKNPGTGNPRKDTKKSGSQNPRKSVEKAMRRDRRRKQNTDDDGDDDDDDDDELFMKRKKKQHDKLSSSIEKRELKIVLVDIAKVNPRKIKLDLVRKWRRSVVDLGNVQAAKKMNDNIKRAPMKELSKSFKETESSSSHESDVEKMTPESPVRDAEDSKTDDGSNKKVKLTTTPKKILQEETRERKSGRTNKSVYVEDTKTDDNPSEKVKLTTTPKKILQEKTPERKSGRTNKPVYTRQTENVDESSEHKTKTKSKEGMSRKDTEKIDMLVTEKIHAEYDGNEDREDGFDKKRTPDGHGRRKRKKERRERHTGTSMDEDNQQDNVDDIIDEQTKDESEAEMPAESKRRKLSEKKSPIKVTKSSKTEKPCDLDSENISKESDINVKQSKHRKKTKRKRERHSEIHISEDEDKKTEIIDTVEENIKSSDDIDNIESLQVTGNQSVSKNDEEDIHEKGSEEDIHEKGSEEDIHEKDSQKEMSSGSDNDALDNIMISKLMTRNIRNLIKLQLKQR
ncbi:enolase-phosphatase E1-like [Ptychodera flava]|uniref:enolase-phosphatase E1-like n=1 Tax=Ptychodera flava TaxID=63121 RepID=UPI00396A06D0